MNIIEMKRISKTFPSVKALDGIDFNLAKGEILSLLGENGAGKTTLMNILYGMFPPDEGEIYYNGAKVSIANPRTAIKMGICMVHQHFMLVPAFSIIDNIISGTEPSNGPFVNYKKALDDVNKLIKKYDFKLNPYTLVSSLSVGEQQRVEILKALYRKASVLILDEPTAVLTPQEVDKLFDTLRMLREQEVSIVLISHKLRETLSIADRIMVLRNGQVTGDNINPAQTTVEELSSRMVGRTVNLEKRNPSRNIGDIVLSVNNLTVIEDGIKKLNNISFQIRKREILGIAGVEGNGQTQLLESLTGLIKPTSMEFNYNNQIIHGDARTFIKAKVGHIPEDRTTMGLVLSMSVKDNLILGYHREPDISRRGILRKRYISEFADKSINNFYIKTPSRETPVKQLSGGNQQKIVIARVLSRDIQLLIVAHPTRGLDIGASEYIHQELFKFRDKGIAILLVSADLDEVCSLSDRLIVLYEGEITLEGNPEKYSKTEIGLAMTGNKLING